jgi:hypothetical protein
MVVATGFDDDNEPWKKAQKVMKAQGVAKEVRESMADPYTFAVKKVISTFVNYLIRRADADRDKDHG